MRKSTTANYLPTNAINYDFRKTKSVNCISEPLINSKLLSFEFSRDNFLSLRSDILNGILNLYNTRLFSEYIKQNKLEMPSSDNIRANLNTLEIKINASEIEIGELNNSLFISAIYTLIETRQILFSLVEQIDMKNSDRIYYVVFINQNGVWREIFLDGILPYKKAIVLEDENISSTKKPIKKDKEEKKPKQTLFFSHLKNSSSSEDWLGLLEKAYAFAYGSYQKMLNCLLEDILYDLTGAVIETKKIKQMSNFELGDRLLKDFNKGSPMVLLENELTDRLDELYEEKETCNQWEIPIIDVRNTKTEYIIVKIRKLKPLKKKELTYNKGSNNWPPDLKAELAIRFDPDDIIWLSLDEIKELFSNLIIYNINLQNFHKSIPFEFENTEILSYSLCEINNNNSFHLGVTICQDDLREFDNSFAYRYSKIRIFLAKVLEKEKGLKFITTVIGKKRNVGFDVKLEKGVYLIYFEIEWENIMASSPKKIKMNFYHSDSLCLIKIAKNSLEIRKNFLSNIFSSLSIIQKLQKFSEIRNFRKKIHENIEMIYGVYLDYYYCVVKNSILTKQYYKMTIQLEIEGSFYTDVSLKSKDFRNKEIKLLIYPNKDLILIFKMSKLLEINPKIIKTLKKVDNFKNSAQDYEIKPFDFPSVTQNLQEISEKLSIFTFFSLSDDEIRPYILKLGQKNKRIVDGKEIKVYAWIAAFEEGVALLIENSMDSAVYLEKITYKVDNLKILEKKQKKVNFFNGYVEINLNSGEFTVVKWKKDKNIPIYSYNLKTDSMIKESKCSF